MRKDKEGMIMKVRPKQNYIPLGNSFVLDTNTEYEAVLAINIPFWKEKGKLFVEGILLERGEYEIVPQPSTTNEEVSPAPWTLKPMTEGNHGIEDARGITVGLVRKESDGRLMVSAPAMKELLVSIYDTMNSYSHIHAVRDVLYDIEGLLNTNKEGEKTDEQKNDEHTTDQR